MYQPGSNAISIIPTIGSNKNSTPNSAIGSGFENSISGSGTSASGSYIASGYQNQISGSGFDRNFIGCLLYTSPSPRDRTRSRMPSSA